jgi:ATP-dependent Clp protease ATP-binding subunit ClpA
MSEYQEEQNLSRLIGEQQGDKFSGGYLTEAVRSKPFSLVLLDEIEKANPKVLDLFLQILDEGFITDGAGRRVDFSNTIIIATSNAASREIADLILAGKKYEEVYQEVLPKLRSVFRVEFLNRFDKVIMFKPLLPIEVQQIAGKMLAALADQLLTKGYTLKYSESVLAELVELGYSRVYGAREMQRVIQEQVEDRIAEAVVKGELKPGGVYNLNSLASQ